LILEFAFRGIAFHYALITDIFLEVEELDILIEKVFFASFADEHIWILLKYLLELEFIFREDFLFEFFVLFWFVILFCAAIDNGIVLGDDDCAFGYRSELSTCKFIEKMVEVVIVLLLAFHVLDRELQFTLEFPQKHVVNEDIVILLVEFILDADQFELVLRFFGSIEKVESI
jgi:hypothetical protein